MLSCCLTLITCGKAQINILANLRMEVVEINEIDILYQESVFIMTNNLR